ncbi:hypothetical protein C8J57DRAFT_1734000 [Mycena rebaudengoi]|nr:hypothetical protein C8J57DRAFT_1734000 [Mycena rebaudengoi]
MHTCMDDRSGIYLEQVRLRRALVMILGSRPRRINVRGSATTSHTFDNAVTTDATIDWIYSSLTRDVRLHLSRRHDLRWRPSSTRHRGFSLLPTTPSIPVLAMVGHARHGYQSKTLERGAFSLRHDSTASHQASSLADVSDSGGAAAHRLGPVRTALIVSPLPRVPLPPEEIGAHAPPDVRAIYKMYKTHRRRTHSKLTHSAWPTHCVSWIFSTLNDADVRSHPSPQQRLDDAGLLQDPPPTSTRKAAPRHLNSCVDGDAERLVHVSAGVSSHPRTSAPAPPDFSQHYPSHTAAVRRPYLDDAHSTSCVRRIVVFHRTQNDDDAVPAILTPQSVQRLDEDRISLRALPSTLNLGAE